MRQSVPATRRRFALVALAATLLIGAAACGDGEIRLDPQQERNIRPGQRVEGTPRSEEN